MTSIVLCWMMNIWETPLWSYVDIISELSGQLSRFLIFLPDLNQKKTVIKTSNIPNVRLTYLHAVLIMIKTRFPVSLKHHIYFLFSVFCQCWSEKKRRNCQLKSCLFLNKWCSYQHISASKSNVKVIVYEMYVFNVFPLHADVTCHP